MPSYRTSIRIARPVAEVFDYLKDVTAWSTWMNVGSVRTGGGETRVGMHAEGVMSEGGGAPFTMEVTELEPGRAVGLRTLSGPIDWAGRWEVRPVDSGTTEVTSTGTIRLHGLRRLLEPLMAGEVQKGEANELVRLRAVLEGAPKG